MAARPVMGQGRQVIDDSPGHLVLLAAPGL